MTDHTRFGEAFFDRIRANLAQSVPCSRAELKEVIIVHLIRGGERTGQPFREVTQVWSKEGVLIAERDPLNAATAGADNDGEYQSGTQVIVTDNPVCFPD